MIIVHERRRKQFTDLFAKTNDFELFLKENYSCLNFESESIKNKIQEVFSFFVDSDEVVQYTRLVRRLKSAFGFLHKNVTKKEYWIERGWEDEYASQKIKQDILERAKSQAETRQKQLLDKNVFVEDKTAKEFRFMAGVFYSIKLPTCNVCNSKLNLKKININNLQGKFYYKIIKCSNSECKTKKISKNEKYRAFLPKDNAEEVIGKISKNIKQKNILCIESWINKGYSEEEAKREIFKLQSDNSKRRKKPFIPTKENLKKYGYSDLEIEKICLSPVQEEFWTNKGLSELEAKERVRELQKSNSLKFVEKKRENPGAYSAMTQTQIGYWINKGYSESEAKEKLRDRQQTFSLDKCIEKYGEDEGQIKWRERQCLWQKTLLENGNLKTGFSKISQDVFDLIVKYYNESELKDVFYASKNREYYISIKKNEFYQYDFVDLNKKKIIEYNGDQYHANPIIFKENDCPNPFRKYITAREIWEKDKKKREAAEKSGFEIHAIWDSEYRWGNKQEVINKCLLFLGIKK